MARYIDRECRYDNHDIPKGREKEDERGGGQGNEKEIERKRQRERDNKERNKIVKSENERDEQRHYL